MMWQLINGMKKITGELAGSPLETIASMSHDVVRDLITLIAMLLAGGLPVDLRRLQISVMLNRADSKGKE